MEENGKIADRVALGLSDGNGGDVCAACIGDPALADFISANAEKKSCTYCGLNHEEKKREEKVPATKSGCYGDRVTAYPSQIWWLSPFLPQAPPPPALCRWSE